MEIVHLGRSSTIHTHEAAHSLHRAELVQRTDLMPELPPTRHNRTAFPLRRLRTLAALGISLALPWNAPSYAQTAAPSGAGASVQSPAPSGSDAAPAHPS